MGLLISLNFEKCLFDRGFIILFIVYYESGINNNVNTRNKRNITDVNIIHRKTSFRKKKKKNY